MESAVITYNLAVSGKDNEIVRIPVSSNPNNVVSSANIENENTSEVKTISLHGILESNLLSIVGLIKMDCEGAEYSIVESANESTYDKIKCIRFEYHNGTERLTNHLVSHGFKVEGFFPGNKRVGRVFYSK